MGRMRRRDWVPAPSEDFVHDVAARTAAMAPADVAGHVEHLADESRRIHDRECVNLNPAANTMNPRAEALLGSGLGSRPSLGYPAAKYETGLEAIEQIEVVAAELAAEVFDASFAEVRVGSGALANLYAFMATVQPGDTIVAPPPAIGGHVTHHAAGAAGLYGVTTVPAPVDAASYSVDVDALRVLVDEVRPRLVTIGGSLNLRHHPVAAVREIADRVGATVLFDAAHLSGPIAGGAWPNPLRDGAHVMTMSTYKSLGGPPAGLLVTDDAGIAERVDAIAFPGLTANFDAANTAALAVTLADWRSVGREHAAAMVGTARALADDLIAAGVPVVVPGGSGAPTESHAFAIDAGERGGDAVSLAVRRANLLVSSIGLPHDAAAGVRVGTNELVRWGLTVDDVPELAELVTRAWTAVTAADRPDLDALASIGRDVSSFRRRLNTVCFVTG